MTHPVQHHSAWEGLLQPGISAAGGGDPEVAHKGSSSGGTRYNQARRVLLHPLFSSEKGRGLRPVINLKSLNEFIPTIHFKMEGMHAVKDLLRQNDWLTKVDLKLGCILYDSDPGSGQAKTLLPRSASPVSVHLSTIWPFMRSLGLYQDP